MNSLSYIDVNNRSIFLALFSLVGIYFGFGFSVCSIVGWTVLDEAIFDYLDSESLNFCCCILLLF